MTLHCLFFLTAFAGMAYGDAPAEVDDYLASLHDGQDSYEARFEQVVRAGLATPYADGPLGEGEAGKYDRDPLIDLGRVDCVTYVEQCVALAQASSYVEATRTLQQLRYKEGRINFGTRNHFMLVDWVPNNPWCTNISTKLGLETREITRTISKADFFELVKAPEFGKDIPDRDVTITYVPSGEASMAEAAIQVPALVVFIGKIDWLFALHCGIYLPDGEGGGKLYHASSKSAEVVAVDLSDYVAGQASRYLGFTVYQVGAPEEPGQTE
jgi:hypothetical protein